MARLHVLAVSARLPDWAEAACADYARRMPRGYEVARIAVRNDGRLRAALPKGARIVALDERGKDFTTAQFSALLNIETAFVIGGPDGLDAYRTLIPQAARLLAPRGALVVEAGQGQSGHIEAMMTAAGLTLERPPKTDLAGIPRAVAGRNLPP